MIHVEPFFDKKGVEIPKIIVLLLNTRHFKMACIYNNNTRIFGISNTFLSKNNSTRYLQSNLDYCTLSVSPTLHSVLDPFKTFKTSCFFRTTQRSNGNAQQKIASYTNSNSVRPTGFVYDVNSWALPFGCQHPLYK